MDLQQAIDRAGHRFIFSTTRNYVLIRQLNGKIINSCGDEYYISMKDLKDNWEIREEDIFTRLVSDFSPLTIPEQSSLSRKIKSLYNNVVGQCMAAVIKTLPESTEKTELIQKINALVRTD